MDDVEFWNALSVVNWSRKQDRPAKDWWNCPLWHPAIGRALRIDRSQEGGVYALAPFRLFHDGARHLIIAAYPTPRILGPIDCDWLDIEDVVAWDPVTDEAFLLGDANPGLFGADLTHSGSPTVFASPRDFFQQWAIERAAFYVRLMKVRGNNWQEFSDADACPGKLAIGPIEKIRWNGLPREFEARGFDAAKLNRTILRHSNVPRAHQSRERAVA